MTRNDLYEVAFRYKKAGLWKKLWDNDVFAVKLKSGEIGYISIMGQNGEYNALGLYIGEEGFGSYRIIANAGGPTGSPFKDHELLLQQRCLQAALETKEDLMPEEVEEVRAYAKANGIKLTGKNAYPQFIKYEPGYHPWKVQTKEDTDALYEALLASCLLAEALKTASPESIGINSIHPDTMEVPLFEVKGETLVSLGFAPLPGNLDMHYDPVIAENQIALAAVKKLPRKGIWETELLCMMEPVQNSPEETPYYPMLLLVVESKSGYVLPVPLVDHAEKRPQEVLQAFANAWKSQGCHPKEIRCRDERTYALLRDFCEKTDVKVSIYKKAMPALDEAEEALLDQSLDGDEEEIVDQMTEVIDAILSMSKQELKMIPKPLLRELKMMMEHDIFPKDIAAELRAKLKGID